MQAHTLHTWIARRIAVRTRLEQVGVSYLLFLMVVTRKHSLEEAARFSGGSYWIPGSYVTSNSMTDNSMIYKGL